MTSDADGGRRRLASRVAMGVAAMHPSYFAFVMATGIISTGAFLLVRRGCPWRCLSSHRWDLWCLPWHW
jgi:hypothetical protein